MKLTTLALIICSCFSTAILAAENSLQIPQPKKPCGTAPQAVLHDTAHCILFFIPEGNTHPEQMFHFLYCCPWSKLLFRVIEGLRGKKSDQSSGGSSQIGGGNQAGGNQNSFSQGGNYRGYQGNYRGYQSNYRGYQGNYRGNQGNWQNYRTQTRYTVGDSASQENNDSVSQQSNGSVSQQSNGSVSQENNDEKE